MRISSSLFWLAAFFMIASPVSVSRAVADDADTCSKAIGDEAIAACTRAINSARWQGHDLAIKYYNRGFEYKAKGDHDRAIADYSKSPRPHHLLASCLVA